MYPISLATFPKLKRRHSVTSAYAKITHFEARSNFANQKGLGHSNDNLVFQFCSDATIFKLLHVNQSLLIKNVLRWHPFS